MEILRCPSCLGALSLETRVEEGPHVIEGVLRCVCGQWYPIFGGVPRMLVGEMRGDYSALARDLALPTRSEPESVAQTTSHTERLRRSTAASFGYEWTAYDRFGWSEDELEPDVEELDVADYGALYQEDKLEHTIPTFRRKSLLAESDLRGRLALDVGCGNGRYAFVARRFGAEVVGIDLSDAVDAAFANTRNLEGVHIVQADIFQLPFPDATFDVVYSIGVLHHTPSAEDATRSLVRLLGSRGLLSVHLYRRRNLVFEGIDRALRLVTTRLPLSWCWRLCFLPAAIGKLIYPWRSLFAAANAVVALYASHHHNFDWYSPPVATHHTEREVARWLSEEGLAEIEDDDPLLHGDSYYARIYPGWARSPDGTVKRWVHTLCPHWAFTLRAAGRSARPVPAPQQQ